MARIHGSKGSVEIDVSGSPTAGSPGGTTELASINAFTLSMARDRVDVTSFNDSNKQYVLGLADITGTLSGFYDQGNNTTLFEVAEGTVPCMLKLIPNTVDPTHYWWGTAYLDASIDVSATGAVTISANFAAAGDWTRV